MSRQRKLCSGCSIIACCWCWWYWK